MRRWFSTVRASPVSRAFGARAGLDLAERVTDAERERVRSDCLFVSQKRAAAESLQQMDFVAEAIDVARNALDAGAQVVDSLAPDADGFAASLVRCGLPSRRAEWVARVRSDSMHAEVPRLDDDVRREHRRLCADLVEACGEVDALVRWIPKSRLRRRARRVAPIAGCTFVIVVGLAAWAAPRRYAASASEKLSSEFGPALAIDRKNETEWLLPDATIGWLDVTLPRAQSVSRVRLLNAHNRNFNDRATQRFRLELYADRSEVGHVEGSFRALEHAPDWIAVPIQGRDVDHVRFLVETWFGTGGGLAELEVVP